MLYETRPTTRLMKVNGNTIDTQQPITGVRVITDSKKALETIDPKEDMELVNVLNEKAKGVLMLGEKPLRLRTSFQYKSGDYCHIYLPEIERTGIECPGF